MIRECETFMTLKILIAGAGMGGLAAASSLMKAGHDVEVYEQAPELGEVGAGIQMSANAMHALIDLGLREEISRVAVDPGAYVFSAFDTGEEISRLTLPPITRSCTARLTARCTGRIFTTSLPAGRSR